MILLSLTSEKTDLPIVVNMKKLTAMTEKLTEFPESPRSYTQLLFSDVTIDVKESITKICKKL